MSQPLTLISHYLCPYVQRATISLTEKGVDFDRIYIDLANKPAWFRNISPLGKIPVLQVEKTYLFESAAILEYLEETQPKPLHPNDPIEKALHRAWVEYGTAILNDIAGFYNAKDKHSFQIKKEALSQKFSWIEKELGEGPHFAGSKLTLVDAVFGPIFRYFDTFDKIDNFDVFHDLPKVKRWRQSLSERQSIQTAVTPDYPERLMDFLLKRNSFLSGLVSRTANPIPQHQTPQTANVSY